MYKQNSLIFLILLFFAVKITGQTHVKDSLVRLLNSSSDSVKVNLLNSLSKWYWRRNADSSFSYAHNASMLSESINYRDGLAEASRNKGVVLWIKSSPATAALPYLDTALFLFKQTGNIRGIADTYNNLGSAWHSSGNDTASLRNYDSSLILFRKLGIRDGEAAVLNYIGIVYKGLGNYIKAIDFTLAGLNLRLLTKDHEGLVFSYINTAQIFLAGNQTDKALEYTRNSFDYAIAHELQPPDLVFNFFAQIYLDTKNYSQAKVYLFGKPKGRSAVYPDPLLIGRYYFETGNFDSAFNYFEKAMASTPLTDKNRKVQIMISLAKTYAAKGDLNKSTALAKEAYLLARELANRQILAESASLLGDILSKEHDYKGALELYQLEHTIKDSFINGSYQNKLSFFEYNTNIAKKEDSIRVLSVQHDLQSRILAQEKTSKNIVVFFSAAALLIGFFVVRNINRKKKRIELQKDQIEKQKGEVEQAMDDLRSAQSLLIQKEKMASLGELTAGIAHEIQNPLNFVNNFSEINKELIDDLEMEIRKNNDNQSLLISADIRANMEKINEHGRRADAIVKAMQQHSHSSSGQKELTDINTLVEQNLELAYKTFLSGRKGKYTMSLLENPKEFQEKNFDVSIKTKLDPEISKVHIIPQEISKVLLNLYNNAFYAVAERSQQDSDFKPEVSVETKAGPDEVIVSVKDNGIGIPAKAIGKIFQPFFTTKPSGSGTGLGLSLAYDIVKAHGGEIKVNSVEGQGAELIVRLPMG